MRGMREREIAYYIRGEIERMTAETEKRTANE